MALEQDATFGLSFMGGQWGGERVFNSHPGDDLARIQIFGQNPGGA